MADSNQFGIEQKITVADRSADRCVCYDLADQEFATPSADRVREHPSRAPSADGSTVLIRWKRNLRFGHLAATVALSIKRFISATAAVMPTITARLTML